MRIAWLLLTAITAYAALKVARSPLVHFSGECQKLYAADPCESLMYDHHGAWLIAALAMPVALCLAPVVRPHLRIAWIAALGQIGLSVFSLAVWSGVIPLPDVWQHSASLVAMLGAFTLAMAHWIVAEFRRPGAAEEGDAELEAV
ncbi:hypothetical protein ONR57_01585 [Hoyosella sp. YIM 151337]|uniref:hypothetical protein n=1 Tax=Hoyosella sp. YIM 151337 TaxID=2992742 RepID=UPI0022364587|nr:hypothetical protein [Hoyosella sp. YIM 151337]MCW4351991.1 hypothetical protein [Hoyosella sp. YIM 151337]